MFRKKTIFLVFLLLFLPSCFVSLISTFNVPKKEIENNIKSLLVLNVYTDQELIPVFTGEDAEYNFDNAYRDKFYALVESKKALVNSIVKKTMHEGKFKFSIQEADEAPSVVIKRSLSLPLLALLDEPEKPDLPKNDRMYGIPPNKIADLCVKYGVDAVYFHYMQVNKMYHFEMWNNKSYDYMILVSHYCLVYESIMYDKNGKVLSSAGSGGDACEIFDREQGLVKKGFSVNNNFYFLFLSGIEKDSKGKNIVYRNNNNEPLVKVIYNLPFEQLKTNEMDDRIKYVLLGDVLSGGTLRDYK